MNDYSDLLLYLISAAILLYAIWLVVPILFGLPYVPTQPRRIRQALTLAQVRPGEVVYDLGAGDGRVLIAAAQEFGARAVGIEISPLHCLVTWLRILRHGLGKQVTLRMQNLYAADLSDADVVFAYMTSRQAARLRPFLQRALRPGTRVVTVAFDLDGWQPDEMDNIGLVFLYRMPPHAGGVGTFLEKKYIGG